MYLHCTRTIHVHDMHTVHVHVHVQYAYMYTCTQWLHCITQPIVYGAVSKINNSKNAQSYYYMYFSMVNVRVQCMLCLVVVYTVLELHVYAYRICFYTNLYITVYSCTCTFAHDVFA